MLAVLNCFVVCWRGLVCVCSGLVYLFSLSWFVCFCCFFVFDCTVLFYCYVLSGVVLCVCTFLLCLWDYCFVSVIRVFSLFVFVLFFADVSCIVVVVSCVLVDLFFRNACCAELYCCVLAWSVLRLFWFVVFLLFYYVRVLLICFVLCLLVPYRFIVMCCLLLFFGGWVCPFFLLLFYLFPIVLDLVLFASLFDVAFLFLCVSCLLLCFVLLVVVFVCFPRWCLFSFMSCNCCLCLFICIGLLLFALLCCFFPVFLYLCYCLRSLFVF